MLAPEPLTWAMMLVGFAGLSFAGWRASTRPHCKRSGVKTPSRARATTRGLAFAVVAASLAIASAPAYA